MIDVVKVDNAHMFGDAMADQHRFRFRHFVIRNRWTVPHVHGMEYDQFDTPAAVYLLWRDTSAHVRGMVRLLPTEQPYMLESLWPDLRPIEGLPKDRSIWENTRFAIDYDLAPQMRRQILAELLIASVEFGLAEDIRSYLLVSPCWVLRRILSPTGLSCRILRESASLGPTPIASAYVTVSETALQALKDYFGIAIPICGGFSHSTQIAA